MLLFAKAACLVKRQQVLMFTSRLAENGDQNHMTFNFIDQHVNMRTLRQLSGVVVFLIFTLLKKISLFLYCSNQRYITDKKLLYRLS